MAEALATLRLRHERNGAKFHCHQSSYPSALTIMQLLHASHRDNVAEEVALTCAWVSALFVCLCLKVHVQLKMMEGGRRVWVQACG